MRLLWLTRDLFSPKFSDPFFDVLRVGAVMSLAGGAAELVPFELLHLELVSQVQIFKLLKT